MKNLSDAEKWKRLADYDLTQGASALGEETKAKAGEIAETLGLSYMVNVVSHLDSAAASELLRNLPEEFREKIISELQLKFDSHLVDIQEILSYPPGTAGAMMSKEILYVPVDATIRKATEYLQQTPEHKKGKVSYIYVVDQERRLVGVIQIRDLIFYSADTPVKDILIGPVVQVETGMSQGDVAKLLQRHRYLGLPVVDQAQRLVGVISADSVLEAVEEKAADTIAKIVGTSSEEVKTRSIAVVMRLRLPWLLVSIASGLLCALLLGFFQDNLQTIAVLFLFVPVVLGLSESTGVQGATIAIRNITLGHVSIKDLGRLFFREVIVGVFIGIVCGTIVGTFAYLWQKNNLLGAALGGSMTLAIIISGLIGFLLPLLFQRFKIDPAIASGPLVLAICDLQTLVVYFGISLAVLAKS
ncbi:MAG: magnesium transporter [Candidatus Omnitrophica bacterium CG1_02_49_16]|nr:MAG: magnesium transporter [Candidatus Omnitrophica bacterium CG1_02_49_16]